MMACRLDGAKPLSEPNAGILLIGTLGTNFSEILIEIHTFSYRETHFKMSFGKWGPFCLVLSVLTHWGPWTKWQTLCGRYFRNILVQTIITLCFAEGCSKGSNILKPRQNIRHFPDDIFKCIFLNENVRILGKIPLNFVPRCPINNIVALAQIMA